jgi:type I restriction enzyme, S subunit
VTTDWLAKTLGEFVRLRRGHDLTASEQQPGNVPIMGSAGPNGTHGTALANGPGVVVGRSGASAGRVHFSEVEYWPHNTCLYVTDFLGNSPRFTYYLLQTLDLASFNSGSAQPSLNRNFLYSIPVKVPERLEQDCIVELLQSFDDRITLLRETNATLEGIAQGLFKSWFVDFDPVRAKMQGRAPEGMDEATAALFPDSLEESELGLVPKGWKTLAIYDLATFINGAAYKAFEPNAERRGRPIIKIAELKSGVSVQTAYSDVAMLNKYLIETGDILFSWSGNPDTSIDTFVWTFEPAWLNQHIFRVLPRVEEERTFVLQMLRHLKPVFTNLARNKQTTGLGHVTVADMKRERIVVPTEELLGQFDRTAGPLQSRIFENQKQTQSLIMLRDALLPRLILGKLRLHKTVETL